MKNTLLIIILTLALVLAACGQTSTPTPLPTLVLDAGDLESESSVPSSTGGVVASAEVRPVDSANLSFPLLGMVKTVEVKVGEKVTAGQTIATLDTVILKAQVAEAEANVAAAEAELAYQRRTGANQDHLASAQAEIDRTLALVDQAKANLAQAILYTPISGTVITVDIAPGEIANPGQTIIVIADLDYLRIETTDLSERDIPAVQLGQSASVSIDALGESFQGQVVDIARQSETVGGDVTFKVTIELDKQPANLRWGMSAEVEILTEQ